MTSAPAGGRTRRTWPQRLLITLNCLILTAALVAGAGAGYLWYRFGQLPRVDFAEGVLAVQLPATRGEERALPTQNWLLVGSDTRAFVSDEQERESFGTDADVGGQRADTIIVLRIEPEAERAAMLSIPRDLWVELPGDGGRQRINTAFEGGPEQLIVTVRENLGIPIHHYAQVDFAGFRDLVRAVNGIEVYFPAPARDRVSGLSVPGGCVELDGDQALAFVRSRHYQYREGNRWRDDVSGDIGRIDRQQDFIRRAIRQTMAKGFTHPVRLNELVGVGIENVTLDEGVDPGDLLALGRRFRSVDPSTIEMMTLPTRPDTLASGAEVLRLEEDEAQAILDRFRGVRGPAAQDLRPEQVRVRVLNGTGVPGQAGEAGAGLEAAGFAVAGVGDGARGTARTTIFHAPGERAEAELLARHLDGGADLKESPRLQGVDAELLTGADFTGVLDPPAPAPAPAPPPEEPPEEPPAEPPAPDC